jgi:transcriptional regulator with XRE-family HTH domain
MTYTFGEKLKQLRLERGWTLEQLAARSGLSISHISSLERGTRTKPSFRVAVRLAQALDVPLWTFLDGPEAEAVQRWIEPLGTSTSSSTGFLDHLPEDLRDFVSREDAAPYLYLAKRLQEAHISPEKMEEWLTRLQNPEKRNSDHSNSNGE